MLIGPSRLGPGEHQVFDVANTRHEVDTKQVRQAKYWKALGLSVAVHRVGLDVGLVGEQPIEDVDRLVHAARDEMAEQGNVLVGHVVVANAAVAAIADVVLRQQVLFVHAPLGAVGRRALAAAPVAGQLELVVQIDDIDRRLVEGRQGFV